MLLEPRQTHFSAFELHVEQAAGELAGSLKLSRVEPAGLAHLDYHVSGRDCNPERFFQSRDFGIEKCQSRDPGIESRD